MKIIKSLCRKYLTFFLLTTVSVSSIPLGSTYATATDNLPESENPFHVEILPSEDNSYEEETQANFTVKVIYSGVDVIQKETIHLETMISDSVIASFNTKALSEKRLNSSEFTGNSEWEESYSISLPVMETDTEADYMVMLRDGDGNLLASSAYKFTIKKSEVDTQDTVIEETEDVEELSDTSFTLTWENDDITVDVTEKVKGAIPQNTTLQVTPITQENDEKSYETVATQLQEKQKEFDNEEIQGNKLVFESKQNIVGFLAYDICLIDENGNEIEPNGEVKVSIEYKEAATIELQDEVDVNSLEQEEFQITVMHFEENEDGSIKEVVDMSESSEYKISITEEMRIQCVEFVTDSFSIYTLTFKNAGKRFTVEMYHVYHDEFGWHDVPGGDKSFSFGTNTVAFETYKITDSQYQYQCAKIADPNNGSIGLKVRVNNGSLQYYSKDTSKWVRWSNSSGSTVKLYMVYNKIDNSGDNDESINKWPWNSKKIESLGNDEYNLYLDVNGNPEPEKGIDILLIIDRSRSMSARRISDLNNGINALETALKNSKLGISVNFKVVEYDGTARIASATPDWTPLEKFNYRLKDTGSGTNWHAGIKKGIEELKARENVYSKKYVLFMTDGEPNKYMKPDGRVGSTSQKQACQYAIDEWNASSFLTATEAYVVDANASDSNYCNDFADAIGGQYLKGNDSASMIQAFSAFAESVIQRVSDVKIQDMLSEYVDFAEEKPTIVVNKYLIENDGQTYAEILTEGEDYDLDIDISNKTVAVDFSKLGSLESKARYEICYKIKVNETARQKFIADKGYPDIGDEGTDYDDNDTSSGKAGFHSNKKASLTYKLNGQEGSADYKHPVVQVTVTSGKIRVKKVVTNFDGKLLNDEFMIRLNSIPDDADKTDQAVSTELVLKHNETSGYFEVEGNTKLKITEIVPMEYTLQEITISGEGADEGDLNGNILTVNAGDDITITIENKYEWKPFFHTFDSIMNAFKRNE